MRESESLTDQTVLGLLRHGQTDWNIDLRLQGTADIPMNEAGKAQIQQACIELGQHKWDLILTSPLGRAKHSAEIVSEALGISEILVEEILIERAFGIGEGLSYEQWQSKFAGLDQIPGAESMEQVNFRAKKLLEQVLLEHAGKRILAVSHGAFIRAVIHQVSEGEYPPKGERLANASLHMFSHTESWKLHAWSPNPLGA